MADERTITRLVVQKKDANRVSVYLDGAFAFGIHQDMVLEYGLAVGRTIDAAQEAAMRAADRLLMAKAVAFNYLSYRPRTEFEVRKKLRDKEYEEAVVEAVIERLYTLQYLDDAAYARSYAQGRLANRGYGPQRIRNELQRRGVARPLIDQAMENLAAEATWLGKARAQAEKRWLRLAREPDLRKRRKKLTDYLLRRGFSYETVRQVVDEVAAS